MLIVVFRKTIIMSFLIVVPYSSVSFWYHTTLDGARLGEVYLSPCSVQVKLNFGDGDVFSTGLLAWSGLWRRWAAESGPNKSGRLKSSFANNRPYLSAGIPYTMEWLSKINALSFTQGSERSELNCMYGCVYEKNLRV